MKETVNGRGQNDTNIGNKNYSAEQGIKRRKQFA